MNLDLLIDKLFSTKREIRVYAIAQLLKLQEKEVVERLLPFLDSHDALVRNTVSLVLVEYSDPAIVKPLLNAIMRKKNRGANGTMVWALQNKDLSSDVLDLFKILVSHEYEAQMMVVPLIRKGEFTIDSRLRKRITDYIEERKNLVDRRAINTARKLLNEKAVN